MRVSQSVSRILFPKDGASVIYLRGLPSRPIAFRPWWTGRPKPGLHDLSARKVCLSRKLPSGRVGPYPTFSPLPRPQAWPYPFCCTFCRRRVAPNAPPVSRGTAPCAVRTFLRPAKAGQRQINCGAKIDGLSANHHHFRCTVTIFTIGGIVVLEVGKAIQQPVYLTA